MNSHPSSTIYTFVENGVTVLSKTLALVSGVLLIAAIVLTCVSIVGRSLIFVGLSALPGDYELVEMLCGLAVFAFMPYCQLNKGNISVDLFVSALGHGATAWTQLIGDIIITGLVAVLVWRHGYGTFDKFDYGDTSFILEIPVWIPYAVALLLLVLTALTSLFTVWRDIRELFAGSWKDVIQREGY